MAKMSDTQNSQSSNDSTKRPMGSDEEKRETSGARRANEGTQSDSKGFEGKKNANFSSADDLEQNDQIRENRDKPVEGSR